MAETPDTATTTSSTLQPTGHKDPDARCTESSQSHRKYNILQDGRESPVSSKKSTIWRRAQSTPPEMSGSKAEHCMSKPKSLRVRSIENVEHAWSRLNRSKKQSRFFEKEFTWRREDMARERVIKDSIITLNIKLNCPLDEAEQPFHCDISFTLSEVYQRPASCIMVMVSTDFSILLHGTSDPAYHITVTALPGDIAITKNKRSAFFIQQFMHDHLGISSDRGVVHFETVKEENFATSGVTAQQEIEALRKDSIEDTAFKVPSLPNVYKSRFDRRPVLADRTTSSSIVDIGASTSQNEPSPELESTTGSAQFDPKYGNKVRKRKSLMSFFGI